MQEPVKTAFSNDAETTALKIPPHSIEAEQAVLGGVFLDKEAWDKVVERVREVDFYRKDHRIIFRAINSLSNEGQAYDIVTVAEWLENHQLLDESGGMRNLAALAENTPSASNIAAYADIVRKRSILRQLISATSDINDAVFNPQGKSSEQILETAEQIVFEIAEQEDRGRKSYKNINAYTDLVMERMQALAESDSPITGIPTGYHDLDFKTAGFQPSDLIIIAGRPSMGKTALGTNIAFNAAKKFKEINDEFGNRNTIDGGKIAFFSLVSFFHHLDFLKKFAFPGIKNGQTAAFLDPDHKSISDACHR